MLFSHEEGPGLLTVENLKVKAENRLVLNGIDLTVRRGEIHFLIGPNGSGKSTLTNVLAGKPGYTVSGKITIDGKNLLEMEPWERAGHLFVGFQYPPDIPGVKIKDLGVNLSGVGLQLSFLERELSGLSGGERKKVEVAQLLTRNPKYVVLDEPDSGVDIDSLSLLGNTLRKFHRAKNPGMLIITHRAHIGRFLKPDAVHIIKNGKILCRGGAEVLEELERVGFGGIIDDRCD